ncbi:MAG: glycerol-3-phosphate acyltransferase [Eubacteriales bacterium]|nr:glycerol-3-phosphate acyltransferase [Eubacteriales bacterium]
MKEYILLSALAALCSYLIAGINPAIMLSHAIHKTDVRLYGSKNPGFTNYKRTFGGFDSWLVLILDITKTVVPVLAFSLIFREFLDERQLGAAIAGLFAMIGHAYPVWYKFKGGKAFVAGAVTIWFTDYRVAAIASGVFLFLLFTVKLMSLSSMTAGIVCPIFLAVFGVDNKVTIVLSILSVALLIWRHHTNIVRLVHGEEKKFYLFGKPKAKTAVAAAESDEEKTNDEAVCTTAAREK